MHAYSNIKIDIIQYINAHTVTVYSIIYLLCLYIGSGNPFINYKQCSVVLYGLAIGQSTKLMIHEWYRQRQIYKGY